MLVRTRDIGALSMARTSKGKAPVATDLLLAGVRPIKHKTARTASLGWRTELHYENLKAFWSLLG